jgi:hypothetical protein
VPLGLVVVLVAGMASASAAGKERAAAPNASGLKTATPVPQGGLPLTWTGIVEYTNTHTALGDKIETSARVTFKLAKVTRESVRGVLSFNHVYRPTGQISFKISSFDPTGCVYRGSAKAPVHPADGELRILLVYVRGRFNGMAYNSYTNPQIGARFPYEYKCHVDDPWRPTTSADAQPWFHAWTSDGRSLPLRRYTRHLTGKAQMGPVGQRSTWKWCFVRHPRDLLVCAELMED